VNIQQLIQGCQRNDRTCQRQLVEHYSDSLMAIAMRYAPDTASAKDVLQEAWIKILKYIGNYDAQKGQFQSWMCKIVINTALHRYKKLRYETELSGLESVSERSKIPDVYAQLDAEDLMRLIGELPDGYRIVFNLFVIEGYNHKEIASMLDIKEASSRSQLQRARKLLQQLILQQENNSRHESKAI